MNFQQLAGIPPALHATTTQPTKVNQQSYSPIANQPNNPSTIQLSQPAIPIIHSFIYTYNHNGKPDN